MNNIDRTTGINPRRTITIALLATLMISLLMLVPSARATYVSLSKTHTPSPSPGGLDPTGTYDKFHPGDTVTFNIELNVLVVEGGASLSIRDLNLTDVLPLGFTYVNGSQTSNPVAISFSYDPGTRTLFWDFGPGPFTTAPQAVASFDATVNADVPDGTYLVNGVTARYHETITGQGSAPSTTDTIYVSYPILDITKECVPEKVLVGDTITYTCTLTNTGHQDQYQHSKFSAYILRVNSPLAEQLKC